MTHAQVDKEFIGALCVPRGFSAAARYCGIKRESHFDLGIIMSDTPCSAAWVSTLNKVVAAPITVSLQHLALSKEKMRALILNSGNANAVTGNQGILDAKQMCAWVGAYLQNVRAEEVAVMSTGVIGHLLPMAKLKEHIPILCQELALSGYEGAHSFARAMMTTDTYAKFGTVRKEGWSIGGASKGSGMIHPNMATMLAVITTDAAIAWSDLQEILQRCAKRTFNRISVDGDTSTNDMVLLLANGKSTIRPNLEEFEDALLQLCTHLAKEIVRDGEGASKFVTLNVRECGSEEDGEKIAKTIATSSLVKTALYGRDANWGRILAAIGRAGVAIEPEKISLDINGLRVLTKGVPQKITDEDGRRALTPVDIVVDVHMGTGSYGVTYWTCDLSHKYITINSAYRT